MYYPKRVKPRSHVDPVVASARLTGFAGLGLLIGLFFEGLTLLSIRHFVVLHIIIGLFLIPLTLVKLGSVSFRFISYYTGNQRFKNAGPPVALLRFIGPIVVVSTIVLFGSGIWLAFGGPSSYNSLASGLHKGSFVIWFGAMAIHVVGHISELPKTALSDWLTRTGKIAIAFGREHVPIKGASARLALVVTSFALGIFLVLATLKGASAWGSF